MFFRSIRIGHPSRWGVCWLLFGVLLLALPLQALASVPSTEAKKVLVLNSYHPGLAWTDRIMAGVREVFSTSGRPVQLYVEYLDAKRHSDPEYLFHIMDDVLRYKLAHLSFDLVLVSDNDAFNFAIKHRDDLFAGIPIVFCGVNDFHPAMLAGRHDITGVAERPSFRATIEEALRLHPDTRELIFIGRTLDTTGRIITRQLQALAPAFSSRAAVIFWNDLDVGALQQRLRRLQSGALVFLATVVSGAHGGVLSYEESARRLRKVASVPLYGFWDFDLGNGIVGGKLVSAEQQGRLAAGLALRVLGGVDADRLAVVSSEANRYMFDHRELKRFGIAESRLPHGSQIINLPPSFYTVDKKHLWLALAVIALLAGCSGVLLWNIWSRRRAEEALRQSEERLRFALDGSQEALWDWNVPSGRNLVDERWCAMLGYRREEIRDHIDQWQTLVHPEDLPAVNRAHEACMAGRSTHFEEEFRMRTRAGEWKWILGRGMVVKRDAAGRPLRLVGTHKDLSRQKEAELVLKEALADARRARDKIDAILRSVGDGLLVTDTAGRIILMNQAAEKLLCLSLEQACGRTAEELAAALPEPLLRDLTGAAESQILDMEIADAQAGLVRVVQARTCAVEDHEGLYSGLVTILRDVTQAREMERMKNEFISTAAHELRTPLTSVLGFAELAMHQQEVDVEAQREYLAIIYEKGQTLTKIVDELLDLSRMESGRLVSLEKERCCLGELVRQLASHYARVSPRHRVEAVVPPYEPELWIDRGKILQVLENILGNALKYSPRGGAIRLVAGPEQDEYRVAVADEGIGMTAEQVARVFDKFYRADVSNTAIEGLGLGMTIARKIVEAHNGRIWVESEEGRGTKVVFALPLEASFTRPADEPFGSLAGGGAI